MTTMHTNHARYDNGSRSSRRSKQRQLLRDAAELLSPTRRPRALLPLSWRTIYPEFGLTYRTGPRFGQQLAAAREVA